MKRTKFFVAALGLLSAGFLNAQEAEAFKPNGKVSAKVYSNYTSEITGGDVQSVGFNLDRAYFGYNYNVSEVLSAEVKLDVGNESALSAQRIAYFKTAAATYKLSSETAISFGLIGLNQFGEQEKAWGYRYVYKSFQDQHKFANAADLGIIVKHKLSDQIDVDFTVVNGEGYKKTQSDLDFLYAFGATFNPNKQVLFRVSGDYSTMREKPVSLASLLCIMPNEDFSFSAEYNYEINYKGTDKDLAGLSFYTTYAIDSKVSLYGRYDKLWSNVVEGDIDPWNTAKDGNAVIAGLQFTPTKNLKLAVNYSNWIFDDKAKDTKNMIGLYTEFKF